MQDARMRLWRMTLGSWPLIIFKAIILCCAFSGYAQSSPAEGPDSVVAISTFWSQTGIKPGEQIHLAVVLDIRNPYHVNANLAIAPYVPLNVQIVGAPEDLEGTTALYPEPEIVDFGIGSSKEKIPVFNGRTIVFLTLAAAGSAKTGERPIQLRIEYQACDDRICLFPVDVT